MSKKQQKSQKEISQYIFDDYIFNRELNKVDDILKDVDLLVDNNLAVKITDTEDIGYSSVSEYKIASKFICEYNKELKKYKRKQLDYEFGNDFVTADTPKEILELSKEGLDVGTYYAILGNGKHDDYMILD